jgi:hypothetical protein
MKEMYFYIPSGLNGAEGNRTLLFAVSVFGVSFFLNSVNKCSASFLFFNLLIDVMFEKSYALFATLCLSENS